MESFLLTSDQQRTIDVLISQMTDNNILISDLQQQNDEILRMVDTIINGRNNTSRNVSNNRRSSRNRVRYNQPGPNSGHWNNGENTVRRNTLFSRMSDNLLNRRDSQSIEPITMQWTFMLDNSGNSLILDGSGNLSSGSIMGASNGLYNSGSNMIREMMMTLMTNIEESEENREQGLTEEVIARETEEVEHRSIGIYDMCPIGLERFTSEDTILKIRICGHLFKKENILRHFENHSRCPVCRVELNTTLNN
jgi:hypothetical protein